MFSRLPPSQVASYSRRMQFVDQELEEFRAIYEKEFGETITLAEARAMATRLMDLFVLLCKPLPEEIEAREMARAEKEAAS